MYKIHGNRGIGKTSALFSYARRVGCKVAVGNKFHYRELAEKYGLDFNQVVSWNDVDKLVENGEKFVIDELDYFFANKYKRCLIGYSNTQYDPDDYNLEKFTID